MKSFNDVKIAEAISQGILKIDANLGVVYATRSNNPDSPAGSLTKKGYVRIGFNFNGETVNVMAHRIVWIFKHGVPKDPLLQINHKNGIKSDNRGCNLEIGSQILNMAHAKEFGLLRPRRRVKNGHARLTEEQVKEIKRRIITGEKSKILAAEFKISSHHVRHIATGRRWTPNQTFRLGKKTAGRLLDGREHNEVPW